MASSFQTKIINHYQKKGRTVLNIIRLSANGYPDLYTFKKNDIDIWIESKEEKDMLSEIQKLRIDQLNEVGKIAFCLQKGKGIIYGNMEFKKEFELW